MGTHYVTRHGLKDLADKVRLKSETADRAAAQTLNRTSTFAIRESVELITDRVMLEPRYVKKHIILTERASPSKLRTVIHANERGTLLQRYPHRKTKDGIAVKVDRAGGYREIKGAKIIKSLKGTGRPAIGVSNKDFARILAASSGKGRPTDKRARKLSRARKKAIKKPYGMTPLHSRSVNQLFTSVRDDVRPAIREFMVPEFFDQFHRLNNK